MSETNPPGSLAAEAGELFAFYVACKEAGFTEAHALALAMDRMGKIMQMRVLEQRIKDRDRKPWEEGGL